MALVHPDALDGEVHGHETLLDARSRMLDAIFASPSEQHAHRASIHLVSVHGIRATQVEYRGAVGELANGSRHDAGNVVDNARCDSARRRLERAVELFNPLSALDVYDDGMRTSVVALLAVLPLCVILCVKSHVVGNDLVELHAALVADALSRLRARDGHL